jgi:hypothetical protein
MSKAPCILVYEDRFYHGLDGLLLRLARDEGVWPRELSWDHISAYGAGSLVRDARNATDHAEIVVAIGDADWPRTLLGAEYQAGDEPGQGETPRDYAERLSTRFTNVLRSGLAPARQGCCFGITLVWNQESVVAGAYEAWMEDPSQRAVIERCVPSPPTVDDDSFGAEFPRHRLPTCLGALEGALRPSRTRMSKVDVRDHLKDWSRRPALSTSPARWGRRVPGLLRLMEILRTDAVQARLNRDITEENR